MPPVGGKEIILGSSSYGELTELRDLGLQQPTVVDPVTTQALGNRRGIRRGLAGLIDQCDHFPSQRSRKVIPMRVVHIRTSCSIAVGTVIGAKVNVE